MKFIALLFILFSFINLACATTKDVYEKPNTYWQCQCWEDEESGSADMFLEFESKSNVSSLKEAQSYAIKECKKNDANLSVATCLKWIKADH